MLTHSSPQVKDQKPGFTLIRPWTHADRFLSTR